jgi:sulfur-oxidizing protein SoxA
MNRDISLAAVAGAALFAIAAGCAQAQGNDTAAEIEKYRQALADGNPAELWEARGEAMWNEARGPNKVSLAKCDLGMGPGVVKGAYAHLPRYFADTGRVMDLETRIFHCMSSLQGISEAESHKVLFGGPGHRADIEALTAYVTSQSKGTVINVSLADPQMKEMYAIGEKIFFYRGGPHDFACATCHGEDNKRIRLQDLPDLTKKAGAQKAYATWPAYRVSQGELRTMQWRLNDCFRQQRFPDLVYGSPASIALTTYLAYNANGAVYDGPALKR